MTFQDLTNEEILFLFYEISEEFQRYQNILETKKIKESISVFDYGRINIEHDLTKDDMDDLVMDKHYLFIVSLYKKLELIASIISEAEPQLASAVEVSFLKRF